MTILPALALVVASACGDAPGSGAPGLPLAQVPDTLVISDDPALRAMALEMLPELAARSGLEVREPIRLARRTREELEGYLRSKLDEELPPERAERLVASYARLGLMEEDLDLRGLLLDVYLEQVAGFYDPDSTTLYVLADQDEAAVAPVLLHELVHAVQDQWADLDALTDPSRGNDATTAAQAAIEGHATLVMFESMMAQMQGGEVDLVQVPGFGAQMRAGLEMARGQYPALARAPRIIGEGMLFPYLEGAGFVLEVWRTREGRGGGMEALIPLSTEQILDPGRFAGEEPDSPTPVTVEVPGGEVLYDDVLGAAEIRILLEELAGEGAAAAAAGWDGDRFVLVGPTAREAGLAWAAVWDDEEARDRFLEALQPAVPGLGETASLEAVTLDGRPGTLLRVGEIPDVSVRLAGEGS